MTTKVQPVKTCNCCFKQEVTTTGKTCGVENCSGYVCGDCVPDLNKYGLAGKCPLCRKESENFVDSSIKAIVPVINQNTVFILNTHNSDAQRRLLARLLINHESIDDLNTDDENDGDDVSFDFSNKLYDIFKICLNAFHYLVLLIVLLAVLFAIGFVICMIFGLRNANILEIILTGFISVFLIYSISVLCMSVRTRDMNLRRLSRPSGRNNISQRNNIRQRDIIV